MNSFFIIAYLVILVTITSFCLLKANISNVMKVLLILVSFWCASAYYFHVDTLRGYPTSQIFGEGSISAIEIQKNSLELHTKYEQKARTVSGQIKSIFDVYRQEAGSE